MLKGTATIELTDVKTGKKEIVKHDNLVTNAIQSALSTPFAYMSKYTAGSTGSYMYPMNIVPICPNAVGGILLYEDALDEDPNNLYAQASNKLIGYSGNDASPDADVMRGSMNQVESGPLEDGTGYRFVFDFANTQGNGTISAVGLTSKWGGVAGFGSKFEKSTQSPNVHGFSAQWSSTDTTGAYMPKESAVFLENCVAYDEDAEMVTSVYVSDQNSVFVGRMSLPTKHWKLSSDMNPLNDTLQYDGTYLETKVFAATTVADNNYSRYYAFCDSKDGYIWGFEHAGNAKGNSEGKASVNWIKIKIEDYSFEEGTWEIDAQLYWFGWRRKNFEYMHTYANSSEVYFDDNNAVITGNKLYCFDYNLTGLYEISLSNITDVKFYPHPDGQVVPAYRSSYNSYFGRASLNLIGNTVCFMNGYLNKDEIVPAMYRLFRGGDYYSIEHLFDGYMHKFTDTSIQYPRGCHSGLYALHTGVFRFFFQVSGSSSGNVYLMLCLMSPYLATINNLPTPVQKTADKTMKITYILREES